MQGLLPEVLVTRMSVGLQKMRTLWKDARRDALNELTAAEEARIGALVKKAVN
jgi:hypothetical protein